MILLNSAGFEDDREGERERGKRFIKSTSTIVSLLFDDKFVLENIEILLKKMEKAIL